MAAPASGLSWLEDIISHQDRRRHAGVSAFLEARGPEREGIGFARSPTSRRLDVKVGVYETPSTTYVLVYTDTHEARLGQARHELTSRGIPVERDLVRAGSARLAEICMLGGACHPFVPPDALGSPREARPTYVMVDDAFSRSPEAHFFNVYPSRGGRALGYLTMLPSLYVSTMREIAQTPSRIVTAPFIKA
jgi:hypothetical protein